MVILARVCARPWSCAYGHSHARPCSCLYGLCARPCQRPGTFLTRPAYGSHRSSANPTHSNALRLRNTSADLQFNRPTQNTWGAWASTATAASMETTGAGPLRVCDRAIGPGGPITVKPKGLTSLRARLWSGLKAGQPVRQARPA